MLLIYGNINIFRKVINMIKNSIIQSRSYEFLWYSYFNRRYDELSDNVAEAMKVCADRAYLDLCRTLRFSTKDESNTAFRDDVVNIIVQNINDLISDRDEFDTRHNELCEKIIETANSQNVLSADFTYGQAQKWLNMTLKYMLLMNFWSDKLKTVSDILHIPVDSYIIEAAEKYLKIKMSSKAWSKWDKDEYIDFQEKIRNALVGAETPMEWENHAWIKIAEIRNK